MSFTTCKTFFALQRANLHSTHLIPSDGVNIIPVWYFSVVREWTMPLWMSYNPPLFNHERPMFRCISILAWRKHPEMWHMRLKFQGGATLRLSTWGWLRHATRAWNRTFKEENIFIMFRVVLFCFATLSTHTHTRTHAQHTYILCVTEHQIKN